MQPSLIYVSTGRVPRHPFAVDPPPWDPVSGSAPPPRNRCEAGRTGPGKDHQLARSRELSAVVGRWLHLRRQQINVSRRSLITFRLAVRPDGSVQARYSHATATMVQRLMDGLTELWEAALDARRELAPGSPVAVLDRLLWKGALS